MRVDDRAAHAALSHARCRPSYGDARARARSSSSRSRAPTACRGRGEAAPLEPYDGVSADRARAALEAYRAVLEDGDGLDGGELLDACRAADDLPQALAAVDLALWDRAGRRAGRPVARAADRRRARRRSPSTRRSARGPRRRGGERRGRARGGLSLREAQGRHRRRRRPRRRRARGARAASRCCAWTPTAPGRRARRCATIEALAPAGLELVEEPVHGLAALRERARARRRADRDGRDRRRAGRAGLGRGRRRLPEARALRRDLRPAGLRDARARVGRRAVRRLDVRRAARDRRGAARRRGAADRRRRAAWRRSSCSTTCEHPLAGARRGDRRAARAGAARMTRAGAADRARRPAPPAARHVHYGEHPRQVADLHLPRGAGPASGRRRAARRLLAAALHAAHHAPAVPGPRAARLRGATTSSTGAWARDGGGWPQTFDDVAAAIDHLADARRRARWTSRA